MMLYCERVTKILFASGMKDLVSQPPFDDAFPNAPSVDIHTSASSGKVVPGFYRVNVGSNYVKLKHHLLDMECNVEFETISGCLA
jgi:hypothetical protein